MRLRKQPEPYPRGNIDVWDWTGTNIRAESQGVKKNPQAIQYRVIAEMKKRQFTVIFDDDASGEAADVVGVMEHEDRIEVEFWHCKFALDDKPGSRIKELYELCGQAQKSVRWREKPRGLFTHLMRREPLQFKGDSITQYELGGKSDLLRVRERVEVQPMHLRVFVVQPGLSKVEASQEQLELLAVTENYLLETFAVPLKVVASG